MAATENLQTRYGPLFGEFEARLNGQADRPLHAIRRAAFQRFLDLGFPTTRQEEWRFTNVAPIARSEFALPSELSLDVEAKRRAEKWRETLAAEPASILLVWVNGIFAPDLSSPTPGTGGVVSGSLARVPAAHREAIESQLARHASSEGHPFAALNTAFLGEGAFVHFTPGQSATTPVHLLFLAHPAASPVLAQPRVLLLAGAGSQGTVVETYAALGEGAYWTNAVTEVVLEPNARLDHYRVQLESEGAFHSSTLQVRQDRDSVFSNHAVTLGGRIVRNDLNAVLDAEGCVCTLNGLYLANGTQLVDNHTRIDHARPHGESHELYKGILDGAARGVFNGKIYVHVDAQKTDAKQTNKTLLLSDDAAINTKPQLEIFADDVRCTHGATVGQLDSDALFYLQSRGLDRGSARSLLTWAFASEVVAGIHVEPVRKMLERQVFARLAAGSGLSPADDPEEGE